MNILEYFHAAHALDLHPALLEFTHPTRRTPLTICGIKPTQTLCVRDNKLFLDGQHIGCALDIFNHLKEAPTQTFFPAWIGYFSYEFSRAFNQAICPRKPHFPDAYFQRFTTGLVLDDNRVIHHDELPAHHLALSPPRSRPLAPALTREEFFNVVRSVKDRIRGGDVYQVNMSLPFYFNAEPDEMLALYHAMRTNNKSPYMGIMAAEDWWLLSGSPERLFSLSNDGIITTRPIAGTKSRDADMHREREQIHALTTCPKENAEHAMLVDLMRNDLNQVASPCSVVVDEDRSIEFYSHVMHLVSEISCTTTKSLKEIMCALFPGGTITGAPKTSVINTIAELETVPRGPYTGSLGYISAGYGIDFNILIRSICASNNSARINAGAGIVIDSDEESEWQEILRKAQAIKDILDNKSAPKMARETIVGPSLKVSPPQPLESPLHHVLFVENFDSFSYNIVDALRALGSDVVIQTIDDNHDLTDFSHVVLGPGPGNPEHMPKLMHLIEQSVAHALPTLGICLGHQALGHFFGARIKKLAMPVHGKPHAVHHFNQGLFRNLGTPAIFTRYHSLALDCAPHDFVVDAYSSDDTIMAIRHHRLPIFGVQFHPESYLSKGGSIMLRNFLDVRAP